MCSPAYDGEPRDGGDGNIEPEVEGGADGNAANLFLRQVVVGETPRFLLLHRDKIYGWFRCLNCLCKCVVEASFWFRVQNLQGKSK